MVSDTVTRTQNVLSEKRRAPECASVYSNETRPAYNIRHVRVVIKFMPNLLPSVVKISGPCILGGVTYDYCFLSRTEPCHSSSFNTPGGRLYSTLLEVSGVLQSAGRTLSPVWGFDACAPIALSSSLRLQFDRRGEQLQHLVVQYYAIIGYLRRSCAGSQVFGDCSFPKPAFVGFESWSGHFTHFNKRWSYSVRLMSGRIFSRGAFTCRIHR